MGKEDQKETRQRGTQLTVQDRRSLSLMFGAAVILGVVIIVMGVQLFRLNRQGEHGQGTAQAEVSAEASETGDVAASTSGKTSKSSSAKKNTSTKKVVHIRKNLDAKKPMVALTFDDGPYDKVTNRIVSVLDKNHARATFFVVGNRVERYAETMKHAYEKGNQIATHTFDHADLSKMKKKQIRKELDRASSVMKKITGEEPTMLRPPYGNVNQKMRETISMPMIYWSVDTEDWKSRNVKKILARCGENSIHDGDIVLMHDLYPSTAKAVETLVPRLKKRGYQLVTVEELFYYKGVHAKDGKVYFSGK